MCRIFGQAGVPDWEFLEGLGLDFQRANFHAAGAAIWTPDNTVYTIKQPGRWQSLIETPQWAKFREREAVAAICHVRHATAGDPHYNRNNHPFKAGSLIGFHHGIISNHEDVEVERTSEVDSEVIFRLLDSQGFVNGLRGWGAIAYFDLRRPGVTFLGSSRLAMGIEPKGVESRLFVSAEPNALGWSVASNTIMRVEQDGLMYRDRPFVLQGYQWAVKGQQYGSWGGAISVGPQGSLVEHG